MKKRDYTIFNKMLNQFTDEQLEMLGAYFEHVAGCMGNGPEDFTNGKLDEGDVDLIAEELQELGRGNK